jgi:hypothetical protein
MSYYLLDVASADVAFFTIVGFCLSMVILYFVIKLAVRSGTTDLLKHLRLMNQFKIDELKEQGADEAKLNKKIYKIFNP